MALPVNRVPPPATPILIDENGQHTKHRWSAPYYQFLANLLQQGSGSGIGAAETPAGALDGTNAVFTLMTAPNPAGSLMLTLNGQVLYQNVGYTLNGATVTFQTGYVPRTGDMVVAWYSH